MTDHVKDMLKGLNYLNKLRLEEKDREVTELHGDIFILEAKVHQLKKARDNRQKLIDSLSDTNERLRDIIFDLEHRLEDLDNEEIRDEVKREMSIDRGQRLLALEYEDLNVHRLEVAKPGASVWSQGSRRFAKRGDGRWTDMLGPGLYDSEQVLSIVPDGKLTHE